MLTPTCREVVQIIRLLRKSPLVKDSDPLPEICEKCQSQHIPVQSQPYLKSPVLISRPTNVFASLTWNLPASFRAVDAAVSRSGVKSGIQGTIATSTLFLKYVATLQNLIFAFKTVEKYCISPQERVIWVFWKRCWISAYKLRKKASLGTQLYHAPRPTEQNQSQKL